MILVSATSRTLPFFRAVGVDLNPNLFLAHWRHGIIVSAFPNLAQLFAGLDPQLLSQHCLHPFGRKQTKARCIGGQRIG